VVLFAVHAQIGIIRTVFIICNFQFLNVLRACCTVVKGTSAVS
jgi:hypothetical protein